jgi:hypothetical protein
MDLTRRQMYAIAIIAMALAMIAVGLGFGARAAIKKAVKPKPTEVKYRGIVKPKPAGMYAPKPAGMYAVGPASSNGMVAIRDPRLDKLYASKLPAIKPVSVPSLGPAPKPATAFKIQDTRGGGVPATAPKPMRGDGPPPRFSVSKPPSCTATGPWPSTNYYLCSATKKYEPLWTRTGGACVAVNRTCKGPRPDPSANLHLTKAECEKACGGGSPEYATWLYRGIPRPVPTAPASPAPGVVSVQVPKKSSLLDAGKPAAPADPRLKALPTPVQAELARLAVRGTATQIRNAAVDLGGSTVGVLGGEFAGAPVGPDDVSAINQYLDQLSRQPASMLAGN